MVNSQFTAILFGSKFWIWGWLSIHLNQIQWDWSWSIVHLNCQVRSCIIEVNYWYTMISVLTPRYIWIWTVGVPWALVWGCLVLLIPLFFFLHACLICSRRTRCRLSSPPVASSKPVTSAGKLGFGLHGGAGTVWTAGPATNPSACAAVNVDPKNTFLCRLTKRTRNSRRGLRQCQLCCTSCTVCTFPKSNYCFKMLLH